ncbi:PH domain-containing protein [Streptomyces scabiei]|uniref:PH domain-containing protein n=1 Tax=Streptomyces scabiei TaxID=1930 RepID=UPI0029906529|nr:PH domain-containing protein [Streptomyces scabiei]MDW8810409.1 PH domain-containing protein [Streptomyces scabiei]
MSTSDQSSPEPERTSAARERAETGTASETPKAEQAPATAASPASKPAKPVYRDRVYRSPAGLTGGVLLLGLMAWLGGDAVVSGEGRTPWLALASMLVAVPLVVAFSVRPAVFANDDRLRVRNPFRVIELPWASVVSLRSGYTNEVVDTSGAKYQLWAIPVSLRGRKKAARHQAREAHRAAKGGNGGGSTGGDAGRTAPAGRPVRAETDQVMADLRELCEARAKALGSQGEPSVRWAWEVVGPAVAGAVLLLVLIAIG